MVILLLWGHLYAMDTQSTLNLYEDILSTLIPKEMIKVYTPNRELHDVFTHSMRLIPLSQPNEADIIIIPNKIAYENIAARLRDQKDLKMPYLFGTDYHLLEAYPNVIGALYWRKGRSQLLFVRNRLKKLGITLPDKYRKYSVESL